MRLSPQVRAILGGQKGTPKQRAQPSGSFRIVVLLGKTTIITELRVFFGKNTPGSLPQPSWALRGRCRSGVTGCGYFFQSPADSQIEPKSPQRASGARTNSSKSPQKRIQKRWGANVRLEGVAFLVFLDDTSFQTLRIGLRHCYLQCFLQYSKKSIFAIQT